MSVREEVDWFVRSSASSAVLHIPASEDDDTPICDADKTTEREWKRSPSAAFPPNHKKVCPDCREIHSDGFDGLLTQKQTEALLKAHEIGYFDIPKEAKLADLSDELGISHQAASERLRRGFKKIVENRL